ncbi:uncharacterized protein LOC110768577 [Prunus avium]|uniref:Uncharacterized protein LOC110768577 n=1 Tax=Prunus avium TaxID=42229 RepID=A0A6P5TKI8_PRUAV|nr:uncharacterized protein LOC110768577 [Prunus avium]
MIIFMVKVYIIPPIFLRGVLSSLKNFINLKTNHVVVGLIRIRFGVVPPEGFYKLNVNGATDNAIGLHSIGAIVRNEYGVFMGSLAMQSPHGVSILATELQAIYRGVLFATVAGFFPLFIETDSSEAVMMINSWETIWATVGNIVDDVRDLFVQFSLKEVQFRLRECNKVAHAIAYFALHE